MFGNCEMSHLPKHYKRDPTCELPKKPSAIWLLFSIDFINAQLTTPPAFGNNAVRLVFLNDIEY